MGYYTMNVKLESKIGDSFDEFVKKANIKFTNTLNAKVQNATIVT